MSDEEQASLEIARVAKRELRDVWVTLDLLADHESDRDDRSARGENRRRSIDSAAEFTADAKEQIEAYIAYLEDDGDTD